MKICSRCKIEKPLDQFCLTKAAVDGRSCQCRSCRAKYQRAIREKEGIAAKPKPIVVDDNHKECLKCHEVHHTDDFRPAKRGRLGRAAYCRVCEKEYHRQRHLRPGEREKVRLATQRYRDNNREHWRGLHRVNQFNRKNGIKAASDGTVTAEFMRELYATECCCWCKEFVPVDQRTAEHVIPLIEGGVHGVSNLKMACLSCNSSKLNVQNKNSHADQDHNPSDNHS